MLDSTNKRDEVATASYVSPECELFDTCVATREDAVPSSGGVRIVDSVAWQQFCQMVAAGAGVVDHPGRMLANEAVPATYQQLEIQRAAHHLRNAVPFIVDECGLRGKEVLEFGSGTGGLSVAMIVAGVKRVTAVEPIELNSRAAAARVRAHGCEAEVDCVHLADTAQLPYGDSGFDAVVCNSVLQYVPNQELRGRLLKEMARVVRFGGQLIISGSGNGLYPAGPHSTAWWSNLCPGLAAKRHHNRGVTYWETARALGKEWSLERQGFRALKRWQARVTERKSRLRWVVIQGASLCAASAALLLRVPAEALVPFPDLAFRKA